ncbi:MAG: adenosine deaminase [Clostridiales bacterium]|nr:adenosine deaminase [Clostridiales bacterium]
MREKEILRMPKIDLHCHLDGSLTPESVSRMLGRPVRVEELKVGDNCRNLSEYLEKFDIPLQCLQTADNLCRAGREFLLNVAKENICYVEVRFAPLLSVHEGLNCRQVLEAVLDGIAEAENICGIPCNVIACAMRHQSDEDNLAMLKVCREFLGEGLCAVDLAGDEASFPMKNFRSLFAEAKKLGLPFTIHAGECGSVENIFDAVECGASRIGHGIAMRGNLRTEKFCVDRGIGIEMCPTSNLQTQAADAEHYPIREFLDAGLKVTINTDNRTVSNTSLTEEIQLVQRRWGITDEEVKILMRTAAEVSFADDQTKQELWKKLD